jgi:hypothetical protein
MENTEIYKQIPIEGFEKYEVSNKGKVRNTATNVILANSLKAGYHYVGLKDKNNKAHSKRLHILVAKAFIPNNDLNKKFVNHIDGNKLNNDVTNLEWITPEDNVKHAYDTGLLKAFERKVCQYDLEGNLLETFDSIKDAHDILGIDDGAIVKVCKGNRNTAGGFVWKYLETTERENPDVDLTTMKPIEGFPNYRVSSDGKVYSVNYKKFLKTQKNNDGYETVQVTNNGNKKDFLMHRLVALSFIENKENKQYVNHIDGNKLNNNETNLEWVTNSENVQHFHSVLKKK